MQQIRHCRCHGYRGARRGGGGGDDDDDDGCCIREGECMSAYIFIYKSVYIYNVQSTVTVARVSLNSLSLFLSLKLRNFQSNRVNECSRVPVKYKYIYIQLEFTC